MMHFELKNEYGLPHVSAPFSFRQTRGDQS